MNPDNKNRPPANRGGGVRVSFRDVKMDDGSVKTIIEWKYYDGTFDWYVYNRGKKGRQPTTVSQSPASRARM